MTLLVRGGGYVIDTQPFAGPPYENIPVPAGSQIGDLVVIAMPPNEGSHSYYLDPDARISQAGPGAWIGTLDHLDPFTVGTTDPLGSHSQAMIAVFAPRAIPEAARWSFSTTANEGTLGSVNAPDVIVVGCSTHSVTSGAFQLNDAPGVNAESAVSAPPALVAARIWTLDYPSTPSPAHPWFTGGGNGSRWITVIGIGGTGAPPCRLHPRPDHLGVGSGRVWPPAGTRQGGRLNGPY